MDASTFTITAPDGTELHVNRWLPDPGTSPRAIVQIAHGMAEHVDRYARFAQALTDHGFAVYANDHRGHKGTAKTHDNEGYFADHDGWATVVDDMALLTATAKEEHAGLPVVLFGHSMGSFLSRSYAVEHGDEIAALILSGTAGDPGALGAVGGKVASLQARLQGRRHHSGLLNTLTFGQYGSAFKPNRTAFDWLSRDEAEVDKYVADEWCGAVFTTGFYIDILGGLAEINRDGYVARTPKSLPILIFSGEKDPVGAAGKGPTEVADRYRRLGVTDVTLTLYPDGRHEMLNEINRDEVTSDVIAWIDAHLPVSH